MDRNHWSKTSLFPSKGTAGRCWNMLQHEHPPPQQLAMRAEPHAPIQENPTQMGGENANVDTNSLHIIYILQINF